MHPDENLLINFLNIHGEPYRYFSEFEIHRLLTENPAQYYRFIRNELDAILHGDYRIELPSKWVFTDPGQNSDFRIMPCILRSHDFVRKTVKLVGTNIEQRKVKGQITVGKAFAIDAMENFLTDVFEACLLSSARTGICAALAVELLSGKSNAVTIIGAGRVGYYAGLYLATVIKDINEIVICDLDISKARQLASALSQCLSGSPITAKNINELRQTDVLVLATTSTQSFCSVPAFGAQLVISLGADTELQHELDDTWPGYAEIFTDTSDSLHFGDLLRWQELKLISANTPTDLLHLLNSPPGRSSTKPKVFISTGSALFDNLTIGYLLSQTDKTR